MSSALAELRRAVAAATPTERVEAVCRAWAALPSSRLTQLAASLTQQGRAESVPGANQEERERAWLQLAARATVDDVPTLLATPWSKQPRAALARLAALEQLGPDPRIARALLELDTGSRYPSGAGPQFWRAVYGLLLRWGSAEAAARIPRDARAFPDSSPWSGRRFVAIFEPLVVEWEGRWPVEPELSADVLELIERLEARLAPQRALHRALLEAIYARPDDDGARRVFGDALAEQGDPRGEFIGMQFAHARGELPMGERERMQRLLNAAGSRWMDGLDAQVSPLSVFHKGFAEEVRIATRAPDAGAPPWRLVRSLDVAAIATALSDFLRHENTRRVQVIRSLRGATLQELARNGSERSYRLMEVGFLGGREFATPAWTVDTLRLLAPIDESAWWLVGSSGRIKASRVELQITGSFERVGAVVRELEGRAPDVTAITFASRAAAWPLPWLGDWQLELTRVNGRFERARLLLNDAALEGVEAALGALAPDQLVALEVGSVARRGPAWRDETQRRVLEAVSSQQRLAKPGVELLKARGVTPAPVVYQGT